MRWGYGIEDAYRPRITPDDGEPEDEDSSGLLLAAVVVVLLASGALLGLVALAAYYLTS